MDTTNMKTPKMITKFAISTIINTDVYFYADADMIAGLKKYGTIYPCSNIDNKYILAVDRRYILQEVVDYLKVLEAQSKVE